MIKNMFLPLLFVSFSSVAELVATELASLSSLMQTTIEGRPAFHGSALLMQNNKVLWQYHQAESPQDQSFDQHSSFFVGSVSKPLAATLVMLQVQQGKLDLQASVSRYLPELKQAWAGTVRIADLLSHTSGLVGMEQQENYGQFRYHNLNFQLLGQILTAVTKRPYAELAMELLQQCGMTESGFVPTPQTVRQARHEQQGKLKAVTGFMPVEMQPSGGLVASASDIAVLPACIQQQLSKTSVQQMTWPRVLRQHRWGEVYYGYGLHIMHTAAGVEWSHSGYIPGYVSALSFFPEHQISVVVLEAQSLDPADLARAAYYHDKLRNSVISLLSQNH